MLRRPPEWTSQEGNPSELFQHFPKTETSSQTESNADCSPGNLRYRVAASPKRSLVVQTGGVDSLPNVKARGRAMQVMLNHPVSPCPRC